jgi:serine/threonine-protein kinase
VVGEQLNTARTVLQNRGFSVDVLTVADLRPSQTVIGENPVGGTKAKQGSPVTLTVSSGPGSVNVPSVLGDTVNQAKQQLRAAGLKLGPIRHETSSTTSAGDVVDTSPTAGASVPVGSAITLFVSTGVPKVTVPDVTGESEAQAKSDLHAAGFEVTSASQTTSSGTPGTVISQTPTGNTQAPAGTTVTIVVAKAPNTVKVPDVKGQTAAAAQSALQAAGFTVTQQPKSVTHPQKNGLVLSESPGAGTMVKKGGSVTITVGKYTAPSGSTGATGPTTPTTPGVTTP